MKRILLFLILSCCIGQVFAFKPSSGAEVLKVMVDSKTTYVLQVLSDSIFVLKDSVKVYYQAPYHDKYQHISASDSLLLKAKVLFEKAEENWKEKSFANALQYYLQVNKYDPDNLAAMAYIGQCYRLTGDFDESIKWLKKVVKLDFHYYLGHFFLANAYLEKGKLDKAKEEILIAHVLNRNDTHITESLERILAESKETMAKWSGYARVNLISVKADSIIISVPKYGWSSYGMCKAMWVNEPEFAKEHAEDLKDPILLKYNIELNCYLLEYISYGNFEEDAYMKDKKFTKRPEMQALGKTITGKCVEPFIYYEKILVEHPEYGQTMNIDGIKSIIKFIQEYKIEKLD